MKKKLIMIATALFFLMGCKKTESVRCEGFADAVRSDNVDAVKRIVTEMAADLNPIISDADKEGHQRSYQILIERLNKCGVVATGLCYGCIYTNPATSEIKVVVQAGGATTTRVLDLMPKNSRFVCSNMHE